MGAVSRVLLPVGAARTCSADALRPDRVGRQVGSDEPAAVDKRVNSLGGHLRLRACTRLHPINVCCLYSLDQLVCVRGERERGERTRCSCRGRVVDSSLISLALSLHNSTRYQPMLPFRVSASPSPSRGRPAMYSQLALVAGATGAKPPLRHDSSPKAKTLGSSLGHVHRHACSLSLQLCRIATRTRAASALEPLAFARPSAHSAPVRAQPAANMSRLFRRSAPRCSARRGEKDPRNRKRPSYDRDERRFADGRSHSQADMLSRLISRRSCKLLQAHTVCMDADIDYLNAIIHCAAGMQRTTDYQPALQKLISASLAARHHTVPPSSPPACRRSLTQYRIRLASLYACATTPKSSAT